MPEHRQVEEKKVSNKRKAKEAAKEDIITNRVYEVETELMAKIKAERNKKLKKELMDEADDSGTVSSQKRIKTEESKRKEKPLDYANEIYRMLEQM